MKKLTLILLAALLAVVSLVGVVSLVDKDATESETENRRLAEKPELTLAGLMDGSYISELETYYSDTFPGREALLKANQVLNKFYYFSGGEEEMLVVDFNNDVGLGGEAQNPAPDQSQPSDPGTPPTEPAEPPVSGEQEPTQEQPPEPKEELPNYDEMEYFTDGTILITGDSAVDIPTASDNVIMRYAEAVSSIDAALGDQVRTIALVTPNSGQFYSPTDMHSGSHDQRSMIGLCYTNMAPSVLTVDAYSVLDEHKTEDIYFRTDHHWTALGAYYAYTAFCEEAGFQPVPLEQFKSGTYDRFVGSMYTYTSQYPQGQALKNNPDSLTYYLPIKDTQAAFFYDADIENSTPYWIDVVNTQLPEDEYNKYMCFLAGDHPVVRITSSADGPTCVVLKDSYGNAFVPFLTSHYSEIIVIDPREFNQDGCPSLDLVAFAQEHEVQDVILVNYPFMINSGTYVKWLNRLVGLGYD